MESVVLLVAGTGLLFFPSVVAPEWPWDLSRFNALLLGAIYTASMFATVMTVYVQRWAPTRIVVPMIFLFTTIVLFVSLAYLDRFDFGKYSTWLWFLLYIVIPANALYHIWPARYLKSYYPFPCRPRGARSCWFRRSFWAHTALVSSSLQECSAPSGRGRSTASRDVCTACSISPPRSAHYSCGIRQQQSRC